MQRRHLLQGLIAGGSLGLAGCASLLDRTSASKAKVLVVGGGYGGATVSKYLRLLSDYSIDVMMVEPNRQFVSCPVSNLVIGGQRRMSDITSPYNGLSDKHGVRIVHDMVTSVDAVKKTATLAGGTVVQYDKLVLSPGIDFLWDQTEGLKAAHESGQILHASSSKPCATAAPTPSPSPRRPTAARPDPTSAPASSPPTSSVPSPGPRC
jgi:sulfide dehydrogenase [flavocytochrome c] flavoprotein chain